jgi:hypothetical protein
MYLIMCLLTVAYSKVLSWHASVGLQETATVWSIIVLEKRRVAQLVIKFAHLRDLKFIHRILY